MSRQGMQGRSKSVGLAAFAVPFLLAGCAGGVLEPEQDDLEDARARWALRSNSGYVYVLQRSCFCGGDFVRPVRIHVDGTTVTHAAFEDTGEPITTPLADVDTIDDLFDEIADAIEREAFSLIAEYHPQFGYPVSVSIDYEEFAVDEEMAFEISDFDELVPFSSERRASAG